MVKHIGIISCYGFGNVGDDSYGFILKKFFNSSDYQLHFIHDNLVYMTDDTYIPIDIYNSNPTNYDIFKPDYVIIGGGGLFDKERLDRGTSIHIYSSLCKEYNIPYYIVSVGFQFCEVYDDYRRVNELFTPYKAIFEGAEYISVRTIVDYAYIRSIIDSTHYYKVEYHPDLVYSINKFMNNNGNESHNACEPYRDIILVTLCKSWINLKYTHIRDYIDSILYEHPDFRIIFIDFDGYNPDREPIINPDTILMHYSNAEYIYGKEIELDNDMLISNSIANDIQIKKLNMERIHTIEDIINMLKRTHTLITGRYHGIILGKTMNVSNIYTAGFNNYKFRAEYNSNHKNIPNNILEQLSLEPLYTIKSYIDNNITSVAHKWSEHTRNANINTVHILTNIDIPLIQNWYNADIEYYINNKKLKFD